MANGLGMGGQMGTRVLLKRGVADCHQSCHAADGEDVVSCRFNISLSLLVAVCAQQQNHALNGRHLWIKLHVERGWIGADDAIMKRIITIRAYGFIQLAVLTTRPGEG